MNTGVAEVFDIVVNNPKENLFEPAVGLLLMKHINDVGKNFGIKIPDRAKWGKLRTTSEQLADALLRVSTAIEEGNIKLQGVFTRFAFSNLNTLKLERIWELLNLVDNLDFSCQSCAKAVSQNFIQSIKENKSLYEHSSPESVGDLIVELADFRDGDEVIDITMGLAGFLIKAASKNPKIKLYGQDIDENSVALAKANMLFNGISNWNFKVGDVLVNPGFVEENELKKFDVAISNFPFLSTGWDAKQVKADKFGRFTHGVRPSMSGDWIFIQHMISTLKEQGKALSVITSGALVKEFDIGVRRELVERDLIEAVIDLPANLFPNTAIPVSILILNNSKEAHRKNKVLFIDATKIYERSRGQVFLIEKHIAFIVNIFKSGSEKANFSGFVDIEELRKNEYKLNSSLYLRLNKVIETLKNTIRLEQIANSIYRGVQISPAEIEDLKNKPGKKYGFVSVGDIIEDKIITDKSPKIGLRDNRWASMYVLEEGDILITSRTSSVKTAIVEKDTPPAIAGGNLLCIKIDKTQLDPYYLKILLDSPLGRKMIEGAQTGSVVQVLTPKNLGKLAIPYLPLKDQVEIVKTHRHSKENYMDVVSKAREKYDRELSEIYSRMGLDEAISILKS